MDNVKQRFLNHSVVILISNTGKNTETITGYVTRENLETDMVEVAFEDEQLGLTVLPRDRVISITDIHIPKWYENISNKYKYNTIKLLGVC